MRTARGGAARRAEPDHAIRGGRRAGARLGTRRARGGDGAAAGGRAHGGRPRPVPAPRRPFLRRGKQTGASTCLMQLGRAGVGEEP